MKDSTAFMLSSCLESVISDPAGTGYPGVNMHGRSMPCAGKTGNTNDDKDRWFCGFTNYYTIACWTGYDQPTVIGRGYPYECGNPSDGTDRRGGQTSSHRPQPE